jgi:DNA/RNA endonuclease YhcR with UshA esterase domain
VHLLVVILLIELKRHGEYSVKIFNAQQARHIRQYRHIKEKLHKTKASIWFKKICKTEHLTPNYIHITVNGGNQKSTNIKNAATKYRLNQELKYFYNKKAALMQQLCNAQIKCAN